MLHVYKNECDWVVAESLDDAYAVNLEHCGITREEQLENGDEFEELDDSKSLTIDDDEESKKRMTHGEWASLKGRGHLCSTEH